MAVYAIIPKGKVAYLKRGNYRFVGPLEIKVMKDFKWPSTYTDGTPITFVEKPIAGIQNDANLKAPNAGAESEIRHSAVLDAKSSGEDTEKLYSDDAPKKRTRKSRKPKEVRGEQGLPSELWPTFREDTSIQDKTEYPSVDNTEE